MSEASFAISIIPIDGWNFSSGARTFFINQSAKFLGPSYHFVCAVHFGARRIRKSTLTRGACHSFQFKELCPKNSKWMTRGADETSWNARTVWNVTTFWLFGGVHFPGIFPNREIGRVREFRQRISTKCSDAWPKTKRKSCSALATFSPEPPINLPSHPFLRNNSPMAREIKI